MDAINRIEEYLHEVLRCRSSHLYVKNLAFKLIFRSECGTVFGQEGKSYENMRNAIGILKFISEGEAGIREGRAKPQGEVFDEIEKALKEPKVI